VDSGRFKVFKAIAVRSPRPVEASTIVEEELGRMVKALGRIKRLPRYRGVERTAHKNRRHRTS